MKKFFPLIFAISIGVGGYLYFNQSLLPVNKVEAIFIYDRDEYSSKNPSPFITLKEDKLTNIVVETINSSQATGNETVITKSDYILDIISKDKKDTFYLWLNEDTTRGMYQNKKSSEYYIITIDDTNRLKTLLFR